VRLDFETCLKKGKLAKVRPDFRLALSELKEAKADLKSAREELKGKGWKWAVGKAYYAMFHAARALLLLKGYKERSHRCLIIALKRLYIEKGLLGYQYLDFIETAKFRREDAIYTSKYSEEIALTHVRNAAKFIRAVAEICKKSKVKMLSLAE
jgi:uncharacterized protein (UPF0332 family)